MSSVQFTEDQLKSYIGKVLDRVVSFISIISLDGLVLDTNEAVAAAVGRPKSELVGIPVWENPALAFSPGAQQRIREGVEAAAKGRAVRYIEKYLSGTGELRSVDINLEPTYDNGQLLYVVGSGIDITDLVAQTEELRQTEEEFRVLAESIPQKVWVTDGAGFAIFFNQRWYDYVGKRDENLGFGWQRFLHPDDLESTAAAWKAAVEGSGMYDVEYRLLRHDGQYRWHVARGTVQRNPEGKPLKWFGTSTDIQDQKDVQDQLRDLTTNLEGLVEARTAALQEMNKELEAFSYSISHDLRTPLRSIEGFSQAVLEDERDRLSPRAQKDMERVVDAAQFMGRLIDDLLKLSRLSRRGLGDESVALSELAAKIIERKRYSEPGRAVQTVIQSTAPVRGDRGLLEVVLENLINNAWKFTSPTASPRIEFGAVEKNGETAYFVRDNGVGFDMAFYNKLFGAFQRLHRSAEFSGTGIGLATVRRIVSRHGGKVWAEAKPNEGATFYFTLHRELPTETHP